MFKRIHHIGIAVGDLAASKRLYMEILKMSVVFDELVPQYNVYAVGLSPAEGGALIELLSAGAGPNPLEKFLAAHGNGIHHVAYQVEDIKAAIAQCKGLGFRMLDEAPQPGFHHSRIAFVHPKSTGGILTELVQV